MSILIICDFRNIRFSVFCRDVLKKCKDTVQFWTDVLVTELEKNNGNNVH